MISIQDNPCISNKKKIQNKPDKMLRFIQLVRFVQLLGIFL
jgi:hypothetical protein